MEGTGERAGGKGRGRGGIRGKGEGGQVEAEEEEGTMRNARQVIYTYTMSSF